MPAAQAPPPLRVAVIVGSTREGRAGETIARWFAGRARRRADLAVHLVDLADYAFPGRYPEEPTPSMRDFAGQVGRADAFVVVTPEYNRSFPASLKQAIEFAYDEWQAKPVGFVAYGCRSDGVYAVEHLRGVFTELQAVTMRDSLRLNLLGAGVDDAGVPCGTDDQLQAAATLLDQLTWWGLALRTARAARPYVS
ncbi:NAD(P)H-dependent oxidoreductase [Sphaerisporangium sp. TRM90804]|uniref:NADPH-dependent FMN reductase n=1 Tax=Sphaerisporangium sp. TRM90804 TaxID=3031113 RepID=UPI00244A17E3|nr:NAD(P)H-dependent oxidoreductase [Sphaerisporangium sp. TRM90804]MDH2429656.1 NAD(P)H-dependent oxidoreductase [Sphaerisporangium sp. TRM90804]